MRRLVDAGAERCALGGLLAPARSYLAVRCIVECEDFGLAGHRGLHQAIACVHRSSQLSLFDPRLVRAVAELCNRRIRNFDALGGCDWLNDILEAGAARDPVAAARRVRALSILRRSRRQLHEFERYFLQGYDQALADLYREEEDSSPTDAARIGQSAPRVFNRTP